VHGGILRDQGMVSFAKWFSKDEIEAVRGYVGVQAKFLATADGKKLTARGSAGK
jgi:quinohemoprotein ethanol dehydrogenase